MSCRRGTPCQSHPCSRELLVTAQQPPGLRNGPSGPGQADKGCSLPRLEWGCSLPWKLLLLLPFSPDKPRPAGIPTGPGLYDVPQVSECFRKPGPTLRPLPAAAMRLQGSSQQLHFLQIALPDHSAPFQSHSEGMQGQKITPHTVTKAATISKSKTCP